MTMCSEKQRPWASAQENLTVACEQQRCRPACASVQSDLSAFVIRDLKTQNISKIIIKS